MCRSQPMNLRSCVLLNGSRCCTTITIGYAKQSARSPVAQTFMIWSFDWGSAWSCSPFASTELSTLVFRDQVLWRSRKTSCSPKRRAARRPPWTRRYCQACPEQDEMAVRAGDGPPVRTGHSICTRGVHLSLLSPPKTISIPVRAQSASETLSRHAKLGAE